jgi:hypothetical protein
MKKILTIFLTAMLAFASVASSAEKIDELAWNEPNIKRLRAFDKTAVLRFYLEEAGPDVKPGIYWFHWYPAGDGKYELAIYYASGSDISYLTVYWQDAPGKIRSQDFGVVVGFGDNWYKWPRFVDLNGDGVPELILFDDLDDPSEARTKFIPNGAWPQVYRLRDGRYVEASGDFPGFYENQFLPQLDKAITQARHDVAVPRPTAIPGGDPYGEYGHRPERYLAALIMTRDKILRFLGRDPTAGLAQAREWMISSDPVMVDNARIVFADIGGYDDQTNAAKLATERASKNWPSKSW